ncbi:OmpH family outer membrane protein [Sphingomonas sp.]|uniref:OmpH family outer membrane protein n=1 Tax=Sphingomonas sp. TaxID=28214 RepID=UPI002DD6ABF6|nr:OmpH family outer membrane protein [Sphingomonas sp.]
MKTFKMMMLAAAAAIPGTVALVAPAAAQVSGIAIADPNGAVANSNAWKAAAAQIQTTYKTQIDQAEARRQAIAAELQPLYTKFEADQRANVAEATLRTQATAIQQKEEAGNQEIGRLTAPAQRAQAYAIEQIQNQLNTAVQAAVTRKNVSLLLRPDAAMFAQPAVNITADITTELNRLVPSVQTNPPANWQPGQQQAGAAPAATAPAPTTPARPSTGR